MGDWRSELAKVGPVVLPPVSIDKHRRPVRQERSRNKMAFIISNLKRNPDICDADLIRVVERYFHESVGDSIIKEARWIFKKKCEQGDIVVDGKVANIKAVQDLFLKLAPQDKAAFRAWLVAVDEVEENKAHVNELCA
jgi:hypothetical protein